MPLPDSNPCKKFQRSPGSYRCANCGRAREYHPRPSRAPKPLTDVQITTLEALWEGAIAERKGPWEACLMVVEHVRKNRW